MQNRLIFLLSGLVISFAFSCLLVRIASVERENARQREQVARMRESAGFAREAFDRMQKEPEIEPGLTIIGSFSEEEIRRFQKDYEAEQAAKRQRAEADKQEAIKDLDADIETLEAVSKER